MAKCQSNLNVRSVEMGEDRLLWGLPLDCLDYILSYIPDGALNLILSGDKRLINKVSRTGHLSVCWTKSRFMDWDAVAPLIKIFPKLKSLTLSAWSPRLQTLAPLGLANLPPTLVLLELRYHGACIFLDEYHAESFFKNLVALEYLTVYDEQPHFSPQISFAYFPQTLRSLRLLVAEQLQSFPYYWMDLTQLHLLPDRLETLHLHSFSLEVSSDTGKLLKWPANLSSVTDLAINLTLEFDIGLGCIAANLRRLEFFGEGIRVGANHDIPLTPGNLRKHLPVIEVLHTKRFKLQDWNQLRKLPPTLTDLEIKIENSAEHDYDGVLELLNLDTQHHRFAAPKHIRRLEQVDNPDYFKRYSEHFRKQLSSLVLSSYNGEFVKEGIYAHRLHEIKDITFTNFQMKAFSSPLPPFLNALRIERFGFKTKDLNRLSSMATPLQGLLLLEATTRALPLEFFSILPPSLETLKIIITNSNVLNAIAHNPSLSIKDLSIKVDNDGKPFEFGRSSIPLSITALEVNGLYSLTIPLTAHRNLLKLELKFVNLLQILPNLPSCLQSLTIGINERINLAIPDEAIALSEMRLRLPNLKTLTITSLFNQKDTNNWLIVVSSRNPPQTTFSQWMNLPLPIMKLYAHYRMIGAQRGLILNESTLSDACELYALSCLPRNLSLLMLPYNVCARYDRNFTRSDWRRILDATMRYQFPLFGLPMLYFASPHPINPLIRALPTHLSHAEIGERGFARDLESHIFRNLTGFKREELSEPTIGNYVVWLLEPCYQIANFLCVAGIALWAPTSWLESGLSRGLMYSSAVSSAITAPLLLPKIRSQGLLRSAPLTDIAKATALALCFCVIFTVPSHLLLLFGLGTPHRSLLVRSIAIIASLTVGAFRNQALLNARFPV